MSNIKSPYRYDHVGSFLRPEELKQARKDFKAGKVSREELTAIEDKAITALVEKQKKGRLSHHHRRRVQKRILAPRLYVGI